MAASQLAQHLFLFTCKRGPSHEDPVDFVVLYDAWEFPATSLKLNTSLEIFSWIKLFLQQKLIVL